MANCKIELVDHFPCNSKEELHQREGEHVRNNECVNKCIPGRGKVECAKDHRAELTAMMRKYRSKLSDEKKAEIRSKDK